MHMVATICFVPTHGRASDRCMHVRQLQLLESRGGVRLPLLTFELPPATAFAPSTLVFCVSFIRLLLWARPGCAPVAPVGCGLLTSGTAE